VFDYLYFHPKRLITMLRHNSLLELDLQYRFRKILSLTLQLIVEDDFC
jgi:hypothetical protein